MKIIKEGTTQDKLQSDILNLLKKYGTGAGDFQIKSATVGALWEYFDDTEKIKEKDAFKKSIDKLNLQYSAMRK